MENTTTKLITIEDVGRNLTPIGYTFRSPVLTPSVFGMEAIGRFLFECRCDRVFEHYPEDTEIKVLLTPMNYTQDFREIWDEQNPDTVFPYDNTVVEVVTPQVETVLSVDDAAAIATAQLQEGFVAVPDAMAIPPVVDIQTAVDNTETPVQEIKVEDAKAEEPKAEETKVDEAAQVQEIKVEETQTADATIEPSQVATEETKVDEVQTQETKVEETTTDTSNTNTQPRRNGRR